MTFFSTESISITSFLTTVSTGGLTDVANTVETTTFFPQEKILKAVKRKIMVGRILKFKQMQNYLNFR
jgi:hypothetical protein